MRLLRIGLGAVMIDLERGDHVLQAYAALSSHPDPPWRELVPGVTSLLVDGLAHPDAAMAELRARVQRSLDGLSGDASEGVGAPEVVVPVVYDGADLDEVAALWGTDRDGVVARHTDLAHRVAFCGFSPGFAYIAGLPPECAVPRRVEPRIRVPAGSVAVADRFTGVYPSASPGGWLLVGRTDLAVWDLDRDPPALLAPGTPVRFEAR